VLRGLEVAPGELPNVGEMTAHPATQLTVGQLGRLSGLTPKAIRHYDRIGLLKPASTDPVNGHRIYAPEQVDRARLIKLLREVDLPLAEVDRCLKLPSAEIAPFLRIHQRRLQARHDQVRSALHLVDHLVRDGIGTDMATRATVETLKISDEQAIAKALFNSVWDLLQKENRTVEDDDRMLHMAHASRYHWGQVSDGAHRSRGEWQCSRVYAVLERPEPAMHHALRSLQICQQNGIGDWDLAFAYEALARSAAVAGDKVGARSYTEQALAAAEDIAEDDDRELVLADLETIPGQPRFW